MFPTMYKLREIFIQANGAFHLVACRHDYRPRERERVDKLSWIKLYWHFVFNTTYTDNTTDTDIINCVFKHNDGNLF